MSIALTSSANGADIASVALPSLTIQPQPGWWDAQLRSATAGSGLSAPSDITSGGVFITLPASPLNAGEAFYVYMYAHTGGYSLNSMTGLLV